MIGGDVFAARWQALADQHTAHDTHPLTGWRSPLGWDDEPEPVFEATCTALGVTPWPVHGLFPHQERPAVVLVDAPTAPIPLRPRDDRGRFLAREQVAS